MDGEGRLTSIQYISQRSRLNSVILGKEKIDRVREGCKLVDMPPPPAGDRLIDDTVAARSGTVLARWLPF